LKISLLPATCGGFFLLHTPPLLLLLKYYINALFFIIGYKKVKKIHKLTILKRSFNLFFNVCV